MSHEEFIDEVTKSSCVDCVRYDTDDILCQYCVLHD